MRRKTGGTDRASVGTSCRRSWLFGRGGCRRYGRRWRWWRRSSTTSVQCPKRCPPPPVITLHRRLKVCTGCAWTRSSRRSGPATVGLCRRRPGVAYPVVCRPGTGCAGSCRPNGAGNATLCGANGGAGVRPDQAGPGIPPVPATGPGEGQRRVVADLHRPQPAQAVPLWGGSASRNTNQQVCRKCPEHRRGGRHSEAYETIGPSVAAPGNNNCRRLTSPVPKARQSILRRAASPWAAHGLLTGGHPKRLELLVRIAVPRITEPPTTSRRRYHLQST